MQDLSTSYPHFVYNMCITAEIYTISFWFMDNSKVNPSFFDGV